MKTTRKNTKKGFTIVEILIGLGVMSAVTASTYVVQQYTSDSYKVGGEITKLGGFVRSLENAFSATDYSHLNDGTLYMMGMKFNSNFSKSGVYVQGIDKKAFKVSYQGLSERQCSMLSMKASALKNSKLIIKGSESSYNPTEIASKCNQGFGTVDVVFNSLTSNELETVAQSAPKPTPIYENGADFGFEMPVSGTVPNNLQSYYKTPTYVASAPINYGEYVAPTSPVYVQPIPIAPSAEASIIQEYVPPAPMINPTDRASDDGDDGYFMDGGNIPNRPAALPKAPPMPVGLHTMHCTNGSAVLGNSLYCLNLANPSNTLLSVSSVNNAKITPANKEFGLYEAGVFRAFANNYVVINNTKYYVPTLYNTHYLFLVDGGQFKNDNDHSTDYAFGSGQFYLCEIGTRFSYKSKTYVCQ